MAEFSGVPAYPPIEDMRKIATAGWAGAMESVRLSDDPLGSLAGADEIINRGDREAFAGLLHAIIEQQPRR